MGGTRGSVSPVRAGGAKSPNYGKAGGRASPNYGK